MRIFCACRLYYLGKTLYPPLRQYLYSILSTSRVEDRLA
jgi:hypothetical protein